MAECAKIHLQQSRISKFSGEDPRPPPSSRGREGKRMEGGRGRIGKGGTGRYRGGKDGGRGGMGVVGRGGEGRSTWAPPP